MSNGLSWHYDIKDGRVVDRKFEPDDKEIIEHSEQNKKTKDSTSHEKSAE